MNDLEAAIIIIIGAIGMLFDSDDTPVDTYCGWSVETINEYQKQGEYIPACVSRRYVQGRTDADIEEIKTQLFTIQPESMEFKENGLHNGNKFN